jgi:hypothetical protein
MDELSVLPAAGETPRCADFTRGLAVDPAGTAIRADHLVAAELPLPWPKPVFVHPALSGVRDAMAAAPVPTRVLAAVPGQPDELRVVCYRRTDGLPERTEWRTNAQALAATVNTVVAGAVPTDAEPVDEVEPAAEVWICTQGSHDSCCGRDGTILVNDVTDLFRDVRIRRVSHTGGHRFAPTALTLPDGRMWAYLDPEGLGQILRQTGDPAALSERCRGWWGADAGPAQVAERALLSTHGWAWEYAPRSAEVISDDGDVTTVEVTAGIDSHGEAVKRWIALVRVARQVPSISCRAPGGLPVKPGVEYELVDFREV